MKTKHFLPLVKIPSDKQIILSLIQEELKSRKFFETLHELGMDDCYYQPHLDHLILIHTGIYDGTDETFAWYSNIMDKRASKIMADRESIQKQAFKAYTELLAEKKLRTPKSE